MKNLVHEINKMIVSSEEEMNVFLNKLYYKSFKKNETISRPGQFSNEIYFIEKGLIRVIIIDNDGTEHTIHFAMENQFICDYSSFLQKTPTKYYLQAIEESEIIVLPRESVEWGYDYMKEGQKLGRLIAEFYYMLQDDKISNLYSLTAKERYDNITKVFPNIHNRVPQHMIASYLGITAIHLSRIKKAKI